MTVDLEELAMVLEGDPRTRRRPNRLRAAEVWPQPVFNYAIEIGEERADEAKIQTGGCG